MLITVQSGQRVPGKTIRMIKDIFRESMCPNETLRNSIEDFKSFDGDTIQIGDGDKFTYEFDVITKDD